MKPGAIRSAYENIFHDLQKWDDLPQETTLQKMEACFLSPERIGAIVCSAFLMIAIVALIVILTL